MVVGPCAVGSDLVRGDPSAELIELQQNMLIDFLDLAHELTSCDLFAIVVLSLPS